MTTHREVVVRPADSREAGLAACDVRGDWQNRFVVQERDQGMNSLALLELVETLQGRLSIVVPDEVTARIRTVADLQDAVARLVAAALSSAPTPRT
ncbi:acyl carrier protein [Streptomyces sp. NPDC057908]|uniref:acyl carrier protein n=2 Tax=unclassified Streptomyces TaxID=2593676 RepID=UPI0036E118C1